MKKALLSLILALLAMAFIPSPVYATDEPDSVTLSDIQIFEDLIETDDFMAIVPYSIPFTTLPDDAIDEMFIFVMLDTSDNEVGSVLAYPYNDKGYGSGMVSFYFESGTTWEESYTFRVQENPVYYPSPQYWDFTIGPTNYSTSSDQSEALRAKIIDIAQDLTTEYGVDLLTTSEGISYLSTYGELYFLNAIPGLATMCPEIFYVQVRSPVYTGRTWTYTFSDTLETRYSGTFIGNFMTGFAGLFSVDAPAFGNIASILLFVALILISTWKLKATTMSAFIDGYALLILMMLNGFFSMIVCGFIAFALIASGGVVLFLNRS